MYDITVGTVVNIDIHSMMLFYLHTAADGQEIQLEHVHTSSNVFKCDSGSTCLTKNMMWSLNLWEPLTSLSDLDKLKQFNHTQGNVKLCQVPCVLPEEMSGGSELG